MTDETTEAGASTLMEIPVTKAKKALAVDSALFSNEVFAAIFAEGLKVLLNAGMSKILTKDLEGVKLEEAQAAAMAKAEENLKALYEGKVKAKRGAAKTSKYSREVSTEAMRLAREIIKDHIRSDGGKPSHYKASQISAWAKELLEADPSHYDTAIANLEGRKAKPLAINLGDVKAKADPELVAKANAKNKPKAEGQLSAKQAGKAGKVAPPRQKPPAQPTAH